jgi:hypothetical protein
MKYVWPPPNERPGRIWSDVQDRSTPTWQRLALSGILWALLLALLFALWLLTVYRSGGYVPSSWFALAAGLGFAGLVVAGLRAYPSPPTPVPLVALGILVAHAGWVALSATWALAPGPVWEEATRTSFYLLFFALVLAYPRTVMVRRAARWLLVLAGLLLVGLAVRRFITNPELPADFVNLTRLTYPVAYSNNAGALYLLLFWPLLGIAGLPREAFWVRGLALAAATGLLELAFLTQSRGAAFALLITTVIYFILAPARLRSFLFLLLPVGLFALAVPGLNEYWQQGVVGLGPDTAVRWLALTCFAAFAAGIVLALLDLPLRLPAALHLLTAALVLAGVAAGFGYGYERLEQEVGEPRSWAAETWRSFRADEEILLPGAEDEDATRFVDLGSTGRWGIWHVAWRSFREEPFVGIGGGNFVYVHEQHRLRPRPDVRQPHSIELRVLAETGAVGGVLLFGALGLSVALALAPRARSWLDLARRRRRLLVDVGEDAERQAISLAFLMGFLYWLIHGSVDWLWHMPGVTLGAFLLLALSIAEAQATVTQAPPEDHPPPRRRTRERTFRAGIAVVSTAVIFGAVLPYLSLRYQDMAHAHSGRDPDSALAAADTAAWLYPVDPQPLLVRADVYRAFARRIAEEGGGADGIARALALALAAHEAAAARDSASWTLRYSAALATLDLLAVRDPAAATGDGAQEWARLARAQPQDPGDADHTRALPAAEGERAQAESLLGLSGAELTRRSKVHAAAAEERNPLEPRVQSLIESLREAYPGG